MWHIKNEYKIKTDHQHKKKNRTVSQSSSTPLESPVTLIPIS